MSKKLKFVNQCMHLNKHRSDYDMIARTSSKVFHVRLNAMFPQTSPLNVWLVSWIAILTKHQLQMAVPFCKWIYIYIYIYILQDICHEQELWGFFCTPAVVHASYFVRYESNFMKGESRKYVCDVDHMV